MEHDKQIPLDNWGQIIRKDAKGCFVEIKNDYFHRGKVHLQFVSYDTNQPKGNRYTNNINAYIDIPEFLALTQEAASGTLHMRMQQYKQERKTEPLYEHLGGTSAKRLAKYGKSRPDGKSLSRVIRLTVSTKSDYFLTADCGAGEENKTGLIVPQFGKNPEQHVSVILSWRQINELLLTTAEHYRAWLAAKYMAEWAEIHAPRFSELDNKADAQRNAAEKPVPAQPQAGTPARPTAPQLPPAQQASFASAFGNVYGRRNGSENGKLSADGTQMF